MALLRLNLYPTPVKRSTRPFDFFSKTVKSCTWIRCGSFLPANSAGAQIAAQLANVITSTSYAKDVGITPSIRGSQLKGVVLHSGAYEAKLGHYRRNGVLWAYFGTKDFATDPRLSQFSVARHVTPDFPAMFISAGNDDPFAPQSYLFAQTAARQGMLVDLYSFPQDSYPRLAPVSVFSGYRGRSACSRAFGRIHERAPEVTSDSGI